MPFISTSKSHPLKPIMTVPIKRSHALKFFGENVNELFKYACISHQHINLIVNFEANQS